MKKVWELAKRILSGLITVLLVLILACALIQKMSGDIPGFFGYHLMYVMTGSMEPEIKTGDAVIVHECSGDSVVLDDVVCYESDSGETAGMMITHKVVVAPYEQDGEIWLQTQGTANVTPDDPIRAEQVYGKVVGKSVVLGWAFKFFSTIPGLLTITAPLIWMIIDEIRHIIISNREEIEQAKLQATVSDEENRE